MPPRYFILLCCTLPLWLLACAILAFVPIDPSSKYEHFFIGAILGTLYGETTIAVAWTALGPGSLLMRLPLSMLWLVVMLAVVAYAATVHSPQTDIGLILTYSQCTQWIVAQIPFWTIALLFRLHLRHFTEQHQGDLQRGQFGIAQLMIVTGIIGVILGIGRVVIAANLLRWGDPDMPIFFFLVGTAIVMTLPLVFAAFLRCYAVWAVLGALGFIVGITFAEMPLLDATVGRSGGPDVMHLVWINIFTTGWVLLHVIVTRFAGYRFGTSESLVGEPAK